MSSLKSNKNVKFLLPVVIIIWGLFFFRLFDACNPDDSLPEQNISDNYKPPKTKQKESFTLLDVENDPFFGTAYSKSTKSNTTTPSKKVKSEVLWPNIQYLGIVSDGNSKKKIFILNINGKQYLISQGEIVEAVTLLKGNEEKLTLRFNGEKQEFLKL